MELRTVTDSTESVVEIRFSDQNDHGSSRTDDVIVRLLRLLREYSVKFDTTHEAGEFVIRCTGDAATIIAAQLAAGPKMLP